jgi:hypothetical protein
VLQDCVAGVCLLVAPLFDSVVDVSAKLRKLVERESQTRPSDA